MTPDQARQTISANIHVSHAMVAIAKRFIAAQSTRTSDAALLVQSLLDANDVLPPGPIVCHDRADTFAMCLAAASWISWRRAAAEAIWALIHSNVLLPSSQFMPVQIRSIGWTTMFEGSGGSSSGWNEFEDFDIGVPSRLTPAPSIQAGIGQLSDPDLYLETLATLPLHAEVLDALREGVLCFRSELYAAAVAMLGKASEGAWMELGTALLAACDAASRGSLESQRKALDDPNASTPKKIQAVLDIYRRQDIFSPIAESSGIRVNELTAVVQWSAVVRDARNTIHFGVASATENDYEKVSVLMLAAVQNLRIIYSLVAAARAHVV